MSVRLTELVDRFGGLLVGDGNVRVTGIAPLEQANASQITFLSNPKLRTAVAVSKAAALILSAADEVAIGHGFAGSRIVCDNPYAYFAHVAQWFASLHAIPLTRTA